MSHGAAPALNPGRPGVQAFPVRSQWSEASGATGVVMLHHATDGLVARDPDAWEQLYREAYPRLHREASRRLGSHDAAEDAVSQVMARAMQRVEMFRWAGGSVDGWLLELLDEVVVDRPPGRGDELALLPGGAVAGGPEPMRLVPPEARVSEVRARADRERGDHADVQLLPADGRPSRRPRWRLGTLVVLLAGAALFAAGWWAAPAKPAAGGDAEVVFRGKGFAAQGGTEVRATITRHDGLRTVTLEGTRLPQTPAGQYYELWFSRPGDAGRAKVTSVGTFVARADGTARVAFDVAVDPIAFDILSLTIEPEDGDPLQNGVPLLIVELPN